MQEWRTCKVAPLYFPQNQLLLQPACAPVLPGFGSEWESWSHFEGLKSHLGRLRQCNALERTQQMRGMLGSLSWGCFLSLLDVSSSLLFQEFPPLVHSSAEALGSPFSPFSPFHLWEFQSNVEHSDCCIDHSSFVLPVFKISTHLLSDPSPIIGNACHSLTP